jgi:hypothetical protein
MEEGVPREATCAGAHWQNFDGMIGGEHNMARRKSRLWVGQPARCLVLVLVALAAMAPVTGTSEERLARTGGRAEICISHTTPIVLCDNLEPELYTGYQVRLRSVPPLAPCCAVRSASSPVR